MSPTVIREPDNFGKRKEPPVITISRNGRSRNYVINPALFSLCCAVLFTFLIGYFAATAYLILRDDLVGASKARNARTMHEYEDRIAALRSKLDRVTSRQMLDQQAIEAKVADLIGRQNRLSARGSQMKALLSKARQSGLTQTNKPHVKTPTKRPNQKADATDAITTGSVNVKTASAAQLDVFGSFLRGTTPLLETETPTSGNVQSPALQIAGASERGLFGEVAEAIDEINQAQHRTIEELHLAAQSKTKAISSALKKSGIRIAGKFAAHTGGPFISAEQPNSFIKNLDALEASLDQLDKLKWSVRSLPLNPPIPTRSISSSFGHRTDPFNGRKAMHSGIDYRGKHGTPVYSSGRGTVVSAGRNGGYGKMIEIRHAHGYTSRYAHLSRIKVKVGQKVKSGQLIGKVGSTGRSTGPHLHYEIRANGLAVNPKRFLRAGRNVKKVL